MASKKNWLAMLVIVLVFGISVVGCEDATDDTYTEGDVYVAGSGVMLHYYFSKTLEGMNEAIKDLGISLDVPIKNAPWELNTSLDNNVKNAMDARGSLYSCTVFIENGKKYLIVNRKDNGSWYGTSYRLY